MRRAARGFAVITARAKAGRSIGRIVGVQVQQMAAGGREVIVGVHPRPDLSVAG